MKATPDKKITFKIIEDITHMVLDGSKRLPTPQATADGACSGNLQSAQEHGSVRYLIDVVEEKSVQVTSLLEQLEHIHRAYSQQIINCNALVRQNHELTKRFFSQVDQGVERASWQPFYQSNKTKKETNMAKGINQVTLLGNLGKDPELRYTPQGDPVASFTLATNQRVKQGEEFADSVEWHSIIAWKGQAETLSKYVKKGSPLMISGRLQTKYWDDKETGKTMQKTSIIVKDFVLLGTKTEGNEIPDPEEILEELSALV